MSVVEVDALHKTFVRGFFRRRNEAVRGISLAVEPGEVFGFLGPNGAGKTTTIKILMGLVFATAGKARVFGMPAGHRSAKARIGYLPENPYFYDYLSVHELLDMVGRLHGLDGNLRRQRITALVSRLSLDHAGKRPLRAYSKGMLQRAGLAQALMGDPDLVVLDEPMSGLDPIGRHDVRELILELRRAGKTVFFSTHILSDATLLCDRVGIIVRGRLRDVGPLGELLSPRVHEVQVLWHAADEAAVARLCAVEGVHEQTSEGRVFRADSVERANAFARSVMEARGTIVQLLPRRQTLEELFVSEAQREALDADVHPPQERQP